MCIIYQYCSVYANVYSNEEKINSYPWGLLNSFEFAVIVFQVLTPMAESKLRFHVTNLTIRSPGTPVYFKPPLRRNAPFIFSLNNAFLSSIQKKNRRLVL